MRSKLEAERQILKLKLKWSEKKEMVGKWARDEQFLYWSYITGGVIKASSCDPDLYPTFCKTNVLGCSCPQQIDCR